MFDEIPAARPPLCPNLDNAINNGWVRIEDGEYIGTATDGTEISLGYKRDLQAAERYLAACPTPDTW